MWRLLMLLGFWANFALALESMDLLRSVQNPGEHLRKWAVASQQRNTTTLCQRHLQLYAEQVQGLNFLTQQSSSWALKMLDSTAKFPDGIMAGRLMTTGNFYECLNIETEEFRGKFMMMGFGVVDKEDMGQRMPVLIPPLNGFLWPTLVETEIAPVLRFGLCIPSSCSDEEINRILTESINADSDWSFYVVTANFPSHVKDKIADLDTIDFGFILITSLVLIWIIIGSLAEGYMVYIKGETPSKWIKFMSTFGLHNNISRLFNVDPPKSGDHLSCLDGIRFISMSWVVLGHSFSIFQSMLFSVSNYTFLIEGLFQSFLFQAVLNAFPSVDSFFMISGCLVCYLLLKELDRSSVNFPMLYIHRYLRLTGIYAFVLFYFASLHRFMEIGPTHFNSFDTHFCRTDIWMNFLYINNMFMADPDYPESAQCMGHTWYLANDMQFFLVAPILIYIVWKWKKVGLFLISFITLASALVPMSLTFYYGWGPSPVLGGVNPMPDKDYMAWHYVKPWNRFSPYIVGILLGYILHITKSKPVKISKVTNIWAWMAAVSVGLAVIYGLNLPQRNPGDPSSQLSAAANSIYGGFHRLAWGLALAWVVFACTKGYGGWINEFLSWKGFVPLSRLSFIIYLVHESILAFVVGSYTSTVSLTVTLGTIIFLATLGYSIIVSAVLFVCVELPWLNLEKFIFGLLLKKKKQ